MVGFHDVTLSPPTTVHIHALTDIVGGGRTAGGRVQSLTSHDNAWLMGSGSFPDTTQDNGIVQNSVEDSIVNPGVPFWTIDEEFLELDTDIIPSNAILTNVTFNIYRYSGIIQTVDSNLEIRAYDFGTWPPTDADIRNGSSVPGYYDLPILASRSFSSLTLESYNVITSTPEALTLLGKGIKTRLIIGESKFSSVYSFTPGTPARSGGNIGIARASGIGFPSEPFIDVTYQLPA